MSTLQLALAWLSVRFTAVRKALRAEPKMLLYQGELLQQALTAERVTEDEVRQAIRQQGVGAVERVHAAVLETDGKISIIKRSDEENWSALPESKHVLDRDDPQR